MIYNRKGKIYSFIFDTFKNIKKEGDLNFMNYVKAPNNLGFNALKDYAIAHIGNDVDTSGIFVTSSYNVLKESEIMGREVLCIFNCTREWIKDFESRFKDYDMNILPVIFLSYKMPKIINAPAGLSSDEMSIYIDCNPLCVDIPRNRCIAFTNCTEKRMRHILPWLEGHPDIDYCVVSNKEGI